MEFAELLPYLNLSAIADAIVGEKTLSSDEFADAKRLVMTLADNFAGRDYDAFLIEGVEEEIIIDGLRGQTQPIRGFIDVRGVVRGGIKPFDKYVGQNFILDWKTASTELSTEWKDRLVDSWQWKIYATHTNAALAIYRGVNRSDQTREVIISPPVTLREEVEGYCEGVMGARRALVELGVEVWPRAMKKTACSAFGRQCAYYDDCRDYSLIPKAPLPDRKMSYSQFENFMLCPERSRRDLLLSMEMEEMGVDAEENDATRFGKAVHRGMQELYEQIKQIQGKYGFS